MELVLNQRLVRRLCGSCAGRGCPECLSTGYRGRLPLVELFRVDPATKRQLSEGILDGVSPNPSLEQAAAALVKAGLTNEAEIHRALGFQLKS